jgi:tight adherence protein C
MDGIILALVFASVLTLSFLVLVPSPQTAAVRQRALAIRRGASRTRSAESLVDEEMELTFVQRVLVPLFQRLNGWIGRRMPSKVQESLKLKLGFAGNPMTPGHFIGIKALAGGGFGFFAALIASPLLVEKPFAALFLLGAFALLGWKLPEFWLARQITHRRRLIDRALPDVLDLLSVSVEAGLGLDGAIQKVGEKFPEPTSGEFRELLKSIRLGTQRADALRALAARTGLPDVRTFTAAVIQAEQLGVSIARVLRVQSEGLRTKRRQQVEEKAMALPVKMLFPLILFIFPTIFLVVLGPVVITLLTTFSKK